MNMGRKFTQPRPQNMNVIRANLVTLVQSWRLKLRF